MDRVTFRINGVQHSVGCEVSSDVTLLDYVRDSLELRGTKYMCREGGCGACIVSAVKCAGAAPVSVNSFLVSVTSCEDWEITTIEKVGNRLQGYNVLQTTLAAYNGTQCGYCSPGWIMAMYRVSCKVRDKVSQCLKLSNHSLATSADVQAIDPFWKHSKNLPKILHNLSKYLIDIENLNICKKTGKKCNSQCDDEDWCFISEDDVKLYPIEINLRDGKKWFRVSTVQDIFNVLQAEGDDSYMLVSGNTAKGAYPILEYPRILIDISGVAKLKGSTFDQNLLIGAGTTLTEAMEIFQQKAEVEYFEYLQKFYDHLILVAHIPVRNLGSIAGNLMIKHEHNEFPSDIFLLLETVGAVLTILNSLDVSQSVTMQDFLNIDMKGRVILNVILPPLSSGNRIVTYKIMPRAQNAHAIVNAGFLYKLNESNNVVLQCRIVFGGLSPSFTRATVTETILIGKELFTNETLQQAVRSLESELVVTENPPDFSAKYRRELAINLFYKGLLSLCPSDIINAGYRSAIVRLPECRPVSKAVQVFYTDHSLWPLTRPVQKLEALIQCAGEAPYTEDIPSLPGEVFAAFALSTVPAGHIVHIDFRSAMLQPGVLACYTAGDIPDLNSFTPADSAININNEEVLCSGEIQYYNQPIAIVVAETRQIADRAAKLVCAQYSNIKKPVIDIKVAKQDPNRNVMFTSSSATDKGTDVARVIKGSNTIYGQYHFCIETLVCVSKPTEEGQEVHPTSQWMDAVQLMISRALNLEQNRIDVSVRRLGGAYGIKISRATQVAVACSLVAHKLNRPCRFIQSLTTNMRAVGKRFPCSTDFEMGVNCLGEIQYINQNLYEDNGYKVNEQIAMLGADQYYNCYCNQRWNYKGYNSVTDNAKNSWFRSPGTLESIAMSEYIMERISYELSLDPVKVRMANLDETKSKDIIEMIETVKTKSQIDERRTLVDKFNKENRWKKRGLRVSLMRWSILASPNYYVTLSVYHGDGSVAITHGGIEMGQGINTKAAQICAYFLEIPLEKIKIKGNNTMMAPNCFLSGGSFTSQYVCVGVQRCCEKLLKRLEPIKQQMHEPTWEALIPKAFEANIKLQTNVLVSADDVENYDIFGVTFAEVEVDILTGEFQVIRVDLLQDVGQSVSPEIDIGQVEGAFIMGLGYWTSEHLVHKKETGEVLSDRTWNYYVPQARDIPQDLRVHFRKKSYGKNIFLGSKATGEPSICMSIAIPLAIREAIASARLESGIPTTNWFQIDGPHTVEQICLATSTRNEDFKFY